MKEFHRDIALCEDADDVGISDRGDAVQDSQPREGAERVRGGRLGAYPLRDEAARHDGRILSEAQVSPLITLAFEDNAFGALMKWNFRPSPDYVEEST